MIIYSLWLDSQKKHSGDTPKNTLIYTAHNSIPSNLPWFFSKHIIYGNVNIRNLQNARIKHQHVAGRTRFDPTNWRQTTFWAKTILDIFTNEQLYVHLHPKTNPVTNRGITAHIQTACLTKFDINKTISCSTETKKVTSLGFVVWFDVIADWSRVSNRCITPSMFHLQNLVYCWKGLTEIAPSILLSLCLFFGWQECFIVCVLYAKLPVWYVTLATGEFLDVKNSTKKTQQHGQVGSQCLHSRLRTFRWAPLERFNGEKKHGEWGNFTSPKRLRTWEVVTVWCLSGKFSLEMCFGGLGWMNWLGWMSWLGGMRTADFFIVLRNLITFPMFFLIFVAGSFFTFVDIFWAGSFFTTSLN